jgi:hypothetical protein
MADTPPQYKRAGLGVFVALTDEAYVRIAREMSGRWVGTFPILKFLGFLPGDEPYPDPPRNIFDNIPIGDSEKKEMYPPLVTPRIFGSSYMLTALYLDHHP